MGGRYKVFGGKSASTYKITWHYI